MFNLKGFDLPIQDIFFGLNLTLRIESSLVIIKLIFLTQTLLIKLTYNLTIATVQSCKLDVKTIDSTF